MPETEPTEKGAQTAPMDRAENFLPDLDRSGITPNFPRRLGQQPNQKEQERPNKTGNNHANQGCSNNQHCSDKAP